MTEHVPVLIDEIVAFLKERQRGIKKILDCTIGLGGYSRAVLEELPDSRIWGLDHDEEALKRARENLAPFDGRFVLHQGNFADAPDIVGDDSPFDAILFDLGVSNLQISDGSRGFSFQRDGPLDMRMNPDSPFSAFDTVNRSSEKELADIFWKYGEERRSRQIARGIIRRRERSGDISTTGELVSVIRDILPAPVQRKMGGHPARRVFQALRIFVNNELESLEKGLAGAAKLIAPEGVIAVVSYHSLEDRITKHFFRDQKKEGLGNIITRRPVTPSEMEIERNYKARSAKLRLFEALGPGKEDRRYGKKC